MIEYQVDEQMLEEVQAKLGEMSRKAPTVICVSVRICNLFVIDFRQPVICRYRSGIA